MTLAEMARMDSYFITPEVAATVIACQPEYIRKQAETAEGRGALGFSVIRLGKVTKIPRAPFLRFMGWEGEIKGVEDSEPEGIDHKDPC